MFARDVFQQVGLFVEMVRLALRLPPSKQKDLLDQNHPPKLHSLCSRKTPKEKIAHKVRLDGIDAPEKGQDGYSGAKYSLKKLLWGIL